MLMVSEVGEYVNEMICTTVERVLILKKYLH